MTTGAQAEVYADHFIANHLKEIGGGKTYAQLARRHRWPTRTNAALAAQVQTVFRGETLRGLLLNAYAFWKMGADHGDRRDRRLRRRGPAADPVRPGLLRTCGAPPPKPRCFPKLATRVQVERRLTVRRSRPLLVPEHIPARGGPIKEGP